MVKVAVAVLWTVGLAARVKVPVLSVAVTPPLRVPVTLPTLEVRLATICTLLPAAPAVRACTDGRAAIDRSDLRRWVGGRTDPVSARAGGARAVDGVLQVLQSRLQGVVPLPSATSPASFAGARRHKRVNLLADLHAYCRPSDWRSGPGFPWHSSISRATAAESCGNGHRNRGIGGVGLRTVTEEHRGELIGENLVVVVSGVRPDLVDFLRDRSEFSL